LRYKIQSLVLLAAMATTSHAALISGTIDIAGLDNVRVTGNMIDFLGDQAVIVTSSDVGSVPSGSFGVIQDLTNSPGQQPVDTPFVLPNFLTIGGLNFTLTFIPSGTSGSAACGAPEAAGQQCTPPGSPFNLSNTTANTSTASFNVRGTVSDATGPASDFVGIFSTQFTPLKTPTGGSYQDILAELGTAGFVDASYSASFSFTAVPEPGTISMAAIAGLMLLGGSFLRRKLQA
jgi:hypothetical protein